MHKLLGESVDTALALKPLVSNANHCEIVIAPVYTALKTVADRLDGSNIRVAAQNCAVQNEFGAQTGEVAPAMLKDAGCSHVIIGHSERRQFYGETDKSVNQKTKAALAAASPSTKTVTCGYLTACAAHSDYEKLKSATPSSPISASPSCQRRTCYSRRRSIRRWPSRGG